MGRKIREEEERKIREEEEERRRGEEERKEQYLSGSEEEPVSSRPHSPHVSPPGSPMSDIAAPDSRQKPSYMKLPIPDPDIDSSQSLQASDSITAAAEIFQSSQK